MSDLIPCKICGCGGGEPSLCHAITPSGRACYRPEGRPDHCSACSSWKKEMRERNPGAPIEALCAWHRSELADAAAAKRGTSVPGAFALRVHAARMRRKSTEFFRAAGFLPATPEKPIKERELPLSVQ